MQHYSFIPATFVVARSEVSDHLVIGEVCRTLLVYQRRCAVYHRCSSSIGQLLLLLLLPSSSIPAAWLTRRVVSAQLHDN